VYVTVFLITILLLSAGGSADAEDTFRIKVLPNMVKQGEVCVIRASGPASLKSVYGEFRGERLSMVFEEQNGTSVGLLGIDMETQPGRYEIKVGATDGKGTVYSSVHSLKVEKFDFGIQRLSLPSYMVDLDAKTLERVNKESRQLKALFQAYRDERLWRGAFIRPVDGELSASFGLRRIINDQPRSPHTGIDLGAEEGTPILASNSGVVVLVDELFFGGKSIILDHGWGLYSMYFHLSEALVPQGDRVSKGAILGRVGSTGRSTRPHLHWGIRMNGARVDPLSLLRLTEHLRE
jgi:murein DD-endopeptidase MepM/ murein hydrolase activator NlpD